MGLLEALSLRISVTRELPYSQHVVGFLMPVMAKMEVNPTLVCLEVFCWMMPVMAKMEVNPTALHARCSHEWMPVMAKMEVNPTVSRGYCSAVRCQ